MNTIEQLTQVFNDNFVTYFRSHAAHVNIVGRNFYSDHQLLQTIYEDLQDQIDHIGELLRSLDSYMPCNIYDIITDSHIPHDSIEGTSDELLSLVKDDLTHLKECYIELLMVSETDQLEEIANYAQDRLLKLEKFIWMLKSTLE